jgi:type I restriction enzyme S subunit
MTKYISYKNSGVEWIGEIPSHWKTSLYKHNLTILSGFPFKSELFDNEEGFPLMRIRDITSGTVETFYKGDYHENYIIKKGDIVIGMDGDFNIRQWDNIDILLNQRCCKVQDVVGINRRFIYYTLPFDLKIINDLTYYTTVKHLSVDDLRNIHCVVPPIEEQEQIVKYLDEKTAQIDGLISITEKKIELLKQKRTSLINEAVTKGLNANVEMKDSGVEWIGKIPSHWEVKPLRYVVYTNQNTLTEKTNPDYELDYV